MLPNSILSTHEVLLFWAGGSLTLCVLLTVHIPWRFVEAGEPVMHQRHCLFQSPLYEFLFLMKAF